MGKPLPQSTPDPLDRAGRREWVLAALDQFEGRLLRYAQRLLGSCNSGSTNDEARDVVQFVFLRLCDQSQDEIGDRLAQWLYTVCRNRALDILRSSGREKANGRAASKAVVGRAADHGAPGLPFGHPQPPSRETDPADFAEQAELHALLRTLVENLPTNQREAIDLWADGFSYEQIACITDHEEGHVRVLVYRGLKAIREQPQVRSLIRDESKSIRSVSHGTGNGKHQPRSGPTFQPMP